jgi:hypothetical protein
MWTARSQELTNGRGARFSIDLRAAPATFADVLDGWQHGADFRALFNSLLADAPYPAFRWETPAVTTATVSQPFEFVLLESPELVRPPDPQAFAAHFRPDDDGIVTCVNLGGDAVLVVPCPAGAPSAYAHLAAFVRHAPEWQRHALWQAVATAMQARLGARPVWLSTAGAGVPWLHVRLDDRPKYYGFAVFRRAPDAGAAGDRRV